MALDIKIDPRTRDYIRNADGSWLETDDSSTAVLCQLEAREGKWWGDPPSGSRNAEIMESELPEIEDLQDSTRRALQQMSAAGVITDVVVDVLDRDAAAVAAGAGALQIYWRDRASQKPADLAYSALGGHP